MLNLQQPWEELVNIINAPIEKMLVDEENHCNGSQRKSSFREIPVLFSCNVNKTNFSIRGSIEIASGQGYCSAGVTFDRNHLPRGFAPELLSYVIITGYPGMPISR